MKISPSLVKELREKTGIGMMNCKIALENAKGDLNKAIELLRIEGINTASKKSSRCASDGAVGLIIDDNVAVILEINTETDFVPRIEKFETLINNVLSYSLKSNDVAELLLQRDSNGVTVEDMIKSFSGEVGEKVELRRMSKLTISKAGIIARYMHNTLRNFDDGAAMGKLGVLVALESDGEKSELLTFGRQLAMHIASADPTYLSVDHVGKDVVAKEREVCSIIAKQSGKPSAVIDKIVDGKMEKFFQDCVLLEQNFALDDNVKVSDAIKNIEHQLGTEVKISGYVRFKLGDGVKKDETDFSKEVSSMVKNSN